MTLTSTRPRRRQLTWPDLIDCDPRLAELEADVRAIADRADTLPVWCLNAAWEGWRTDGTRDPAAPAQRLNQLVGWNSDGADPLLLTSDAYHLARHRLHSLLPPCRGCGCAPSDRAQLPRKEAP